MFLKKTRMIKIFCVSLNFERYFPIISKKLKIEINIAQLQSLVRPFKFFDINNPGNMINV